MMHLPVTFTSKRHLVAKFKQGGLGGTSYIDEAIALGRETLATTSELSGLRLISVIVATSLE